MHSQNFKNQNLKIDKNIHPYPKFFTSYSFSNFFYSYTTNLRYLMSRLIAKNVQNKKFFADGARTENQNEISITKPQSLRFTPNLNHNKLQRVLNLVFAAAIHPSSKFVPSIL